MSEEILKAIIQLLAIVAQEDDVTLDEKASIKNFLTESLSANEAEKYYQFFESLIKGRKVSLSTQEKQIDIICDQINHARTNQQKIVVILKLVELIAADGTVTMRESELLYYISEKLNINKQVTDLIKAFVIFQERNKVISSNILIIDDGSHHLPDTCKHLSLQKLNGFLFILRIPELEVYFAKYVGEETIFLNSAPMKTNRVYVFSLGGVIKSENNSPVFHSDIASRFRSEEESTQLSFVCENVSYTFRNGTIGLRNINIREEGGKIIALMGGSGAGKSTLLNVLNGNDTPNQGMVRINGIDIHKDKTKIEGVIGYIPQDDLLIEELSVFQNLYYAAKLCFKDKTASELRELANKTLESLGLYEARNLKVGSPLDKSISGGQRKRLNIGLELLREPSVLFVDEPTSGLSSRDSENIMELLKDLSLKGKMIFVVIHQPSEDIFKMFDKLVLLDVGGYQIYYGNPVEGISYFKNIANMVDTRSSVNPEQIFNIIESKVVNEYGTFTNQRKVSPEQWSKEFDQRIKITEITETQKVPPKTLHIPNPLRQIWIFAQRDVFSKLSNRQYLLINFLEAPLLAILLTCIIRYIPEDTQTYIFRKNLNIPVFFFMSVIVSLFMGLTVSAEEIIRDRKILKREAFLNLSRFSYLSSKTLILFSISAIQTLTYVWISHWILAIKGLTLTSWLVLFSVSSFANILGLNVSSAFKSAVTVYILIPLLIIPQLILSGVVVNFDKLNPLVTSENKVPMIGEIMASRWAYEALAVSQFKNNAYTREFYEEDKQIARSEFKTVYLIPRLQSELEYINIHYKEKENLPDITYRLKTVTNELEKELSYIGRDKFPMIDLLTPETFSYEVFTGTQEFLQNLKSFYNKKAKNAAQEREEKQTKQGKEIDEILAEREQYENEALSLLVKNTATEHRILENRNELVQKIYPIYMDPEFPDHPFDFRSQFYTPKKHIVGLQVDTLYFNTLVIWFMSLMLMVFLYFDWFRKIISGSKGSH